MRSEKQLLLDEIKGELSQGKSVLVTSYRELTVARANQLRKSLRESGGHLEVVRKRVLLKAAKEAGIQLQEEFLKGHVALVVATRDAVATTKQVFEFSKENNQAIEVLAGWIDGRLYNAKDVEKLSELPDMPTMRAQFLGLLEAPLSQTLAVMEALICSLLYCLENKAKQG